MTTSAVVMLFTAAQTALAASANNTLSIVLLGDSYTAGNGAGSYFSESGSYRSTRSWGNIYRNWLTSHGTKSTLNNLAFSGYATSDLEGQIEDVSENTDLVLLTVGGNDVNFGGIVSECFVIGLRDPKTCKTLVDNASEQLPGVMKKTKTIFEKLDQKLGDNARIVLVSYPWLSTDTEHTLAQCVSSSFGICTGRTTYDAAKGVRALGSTANKLQKALVDDWNKSHSLKITYVDTIASSFAGHEPDPSVLNKNDTRWINEFFETEGRIGANNKTSSQFSFDKNNWYHPNITGHEKIAEQISQKVGVPPSVKPITTQSGDIDVAFVVDTTGSMGSTVNAVKANINAIAEDTAKGTKSARFALVDYRDFPDRSGVLDDYPAKLHLAFTSNTSDLADKVAGLSIGHGGDGPETLHSGAMTALDLDWRPGVRKVIIVMTDAPPLDPEPTTGYTWETVAQRAYDIDPVEVYGISLSGGLSGSTFEQLAERTGGQVFDAYENSQVATLVTTTITTSLAKPFGWIQGPYVVKVGDSVTLDGSGSYAVEGSLTRYDWDLDGDGTYETPSSGPIFPYQFTKEFGGTIGLRVTDSRGKTGIGSTRLDVTDDGDITPRAKDNCPDVLNYSQSDYDGDGIGDECDDTPGYPMKDKDGVFEIIGGVPHQVTMKPDGSVTKVPVRIDPHTGAVTTITSDDQLETETNKVATTQTAKQADKPTSAQSSNSNSQAIMHIILTAVGVVILVGGGIASAIAIKRSRQ